MSNNLDTPLWALIPAAGQGLRLGGHVPKQYQLLAGSPMLAHSLQRMLAVPGLAGAVAVLAANDEHWQATIGQTDPRVHTCTGGAERADSVRAGLRHILDLTASDSWVMVHDAARPLVALSDIQRLTSTIYNSGAVGGLLATPVQDTLKKADDYYCVEQTISRQQLWQAQTPQLFRAGPLLSALDSAGEVVTDEASAMEHAGHDPQLVEALQPNFKITRPVDMQLAELLLASPGHA